MVRSHKLGNLPFIAPLPQMIRGIRAETETAQLLATPSLYPRIERDGRGHFMPPQKAIPRKLDVGRKLFVGGPLEQKGKSEIGTQSNAVAGVPACAFRYLPPYRGPCRTAGSRAFSRCPSRETLRCIRLFNSLAVNALNVSLYSEWVTGSHTTLDLARRYIFDAYIHYVQRLRLFKRCVRNDRRHRSGGRRP